VADGLQLAAGFYGDESYWRWQEAGGCLNGFPQQPYAARHALKKLLPWVRIEPWQSASAA
jgi:hypothetical protein